MFEIPTSQDTKLPAASNPQLPPSSNQRSRPANEGDFPLGGIHPLGQLHLCRCCPGNPDSDAGESREEISHGGCFVETALFLALSFHFLKHTFLSILSCLITKFAKFSLRQSVISKLKFFRGLKKSHSTKQGLAGVVACDNFLVLRTFHGSYLQT